MTISVGNIAANPNLDSAISVADAATYHQKRGNVGWPDDVNIAEQLLIKASDYVKATYDEVWSDVTKSATLVPYNLAYAVAELALYAKTKPLLSNITRGKKSVKIGPLSVNYDGEGNTQTQFVFASRMLSPLLSRRSLGGMARLIRC